MATFGNVFLDILNIIGVSTSIGIPGSNLLNFYQLLNDHRGITNYLVRHELNAGFIANGSARSSMVGKKRDLVIAYAIQGPGLANMVNSICDATYERVPSIYITHDEINNMNMNRNIQLISSKRMVQSVAKSILEISETDIKNGSIYRKIFDALTLGFSYPQGAIVFIFKENTILKKIDRVNLTMFKSLFKNSYGFELLHERRGIDPITMIFSSEWEKTKSAFIKKNKEKIINFTKLAKYMEVALSPIVLIGMGTISYISELLDFCRKINIPFILTLPLSGFASIDDPFFAFRMGHTATYCGNMSATNADLIIAIGTSFSVYTVASYDKPFTKKQKVISINIHPELYNTPFVDKYIIADGKKFIGIKVKKLNTKLWIDKIMRFKEKTLIDNKKHFCSEGDELLMHGDIFKIIQIHIDKVAKTKNIYIMADTGSAQPFTASFINFKTPKYHFITCGKYADMGCGLGTIIGFALNKKNDIFILIAGDGATFQFMNDLITIKEMNINNIIIIVLENCGLALINEESLEFTNRAIKYDNGYKFYPNWQNVIDGHLLKTSVVKDKKKFNTAFGNLINSKESGIIIVFVRSDIYYGPIVKINTHISNMEYIDKKINHKAIDKIRFKNEF